MKWRLLIALLFSLSFSGEVHSEELNIGVLEKKHSPVQLQGERAIERFIRQLTTTSLTFREFDSEGKHAKTRLEWAESYGIRDSGRAHIFTVREDVLFHSKESPGVEDVMFSLGQCPSFDQLSGSVSSRKGRFKEELVIHFDTEVGADRLLRSLSECPIFEVDSSRVFGSGFGSGNLYLAGGAFRLRSYVPGKRYSLERVFKSGPSDRSNFDSLQISTFTEWHRALTALRMGSLEILVGDEEHLLEKARGDDTLVLSSCENYTLVLRRGVEYSCNSNRWLNTVRSTL